MTGPIKMNPTCPRCGAKHGVEVSGDGYEWDCAACGGHLICAIGPDGGEMYPWHREDGSCGCNGEPHTCDPDGDETDDSPGDLSLEDYLDRMVAGTLTEPGREELAEMVRGMGDAFVALHDRKAGWSLRTFGPGDRYAGVVAHIRKELAEIEAEPTDLTEWCDVILLAMDGAMRSCGATGAQLLARLEEKQAKNEKRTWPDWRTLRPGEVSEHVEAPPIADLIAGSSVGAALRDIAERGIDAHAEDLARETKPRRRRR